MELKAIEQMLEKYLEGETSLQEEDRLREYFNSEHVAPHLQEFVPLFGYFRKSVQESYTSEKRFQPGRKKVYSWVAIAASIAILGGILLRDSGNATEFGSYDDPELALQKTQEALNMVSHYMNTGTEDLSYLQEFNKSANQITKNN